MPVEAEREGGALQVAALAQLLFIMVPCGFQLISNHLILHYHPPESKSLLHLLHQNNCQH